MIGKRFVDACKKYVLSKEVSQSFFFIHAFHHSILLFFIKAKRDAKLERLNNSRQEMIDERQRKAAEHKARTLAMYDQMARSAPAGGKKTMDIGIYTTGQGKRFYKFWFF